MKKLKLQTLGLSVNDLLSREQMKKVMGGSGGSGGSGTTTCTSTCYDKDKKVLGSCTVPDCSPTNSFGCRQSYPNAATGSCSCS